MQNMFKGAFYSSCSHKGGVEGESSTSADTA